MVALQDGPAVKMRILPPGHQVYLLQAAVDLELDGILDHQGNVGLNGIDGDPDKMKMLSRAAISTSLAIVTASPSTLIRNLEDCPCSRLMLAIRMGWSEGFRTTSHWVAEPTEVKTVSKVMVSLEKPSLKPWSSLNTSSFRQASRKMPDKSRSVNM